MLAHFKKLQASIYAIERYLPLQQHCSRFLDAGWTSLEIARNLWDLWSDDAFTPPSVRRKLDTIEPFDEWEEFALYGGHYFLLVASNAKLNKSTETSGMSVTATHSEGSTDAETINLLHSENRTDDPLTPRRFTSGSLCNLWWPGTTNPSCKRGCTETGRSSPQRSALLSTRASCTYVPHNHIDERSPGVTRGRTRISNAGI
jgi:hypothetical protein